MAGTIVTDRIESDASYVSKIELASPVLISNTFAIPAGSAAAPAITPTGDTNTGIFFPAADNIGFATNGVIRGRWTTDGLCFGSDTAAANALDDYEEGTFTPNLNSGFSVAPTSYSTQSGRYTKTGRVVFVEIEIDAAGAIANGNHLKLGGLPFTVAGSPPLASAVIGVQSSFDANAGDNIVFTQNNTTIEFFTMAGGIRAGNDANVNINNRVSVSGCYTTT